jgi:glycosyltransferase involved in cell wall biosynthesis
MRITFPTLGINESGGGGTKCLVRIADGLVERGHDVSLVAPRAVSKSQKAYRTKAKVISTLPILAGRIPYSDFLTACLSLIPKIPKSDIVCASFCMTALPTIIATKLLSKGIPFYFVQHDESLFFNRFIDAGYRSYVRNSYGHFGDNIITISQWLGDKIDSYTGKRAVIIHPAIDHDIFSPRAKRENKPKVVMCLGVNSEWKGNADIVQAMEIVCAKNSNVKLLIVGRSKIEVSSDISHEQRTATDDELAELYSSCDVFVLGSWYEGFPAPPLEAMACGTPVVSTDNFGIREYGVNEQNCLIVPPRDPVAIADAIQEILSNMNLRNHLIENGLETAKKFSWDKTTDKVEQLFKETLYPSPY